MRFGSRLMYLAAAAISTLALGGSQAATVANATAQSPCSPLVSGGVTLQTSCSDTITFGGHAQVSPYIPLFGGSGSFTFTTSGCDALSDGDAVGDPVEESSCSFTATGTYHSTSCGGPLTLEIDAITAESGLEGAAISAKPEISVSALLGTFTAGSITTDDPSAEQIDQVNSFVDLSITASDSALPFNCLSGFEMLGEINLDE